MSCKKHAQRKRKDCPDCFPVAEREEKIQTSREMLANLDAMDQEEKDMVIKAPRKQRAKKEAPVIPEVVEFKPEEYPDSYPDPLDALKCEFEVFCKERISKLRDEVRGIIDITYEYVFVDVNSFRYTLIDEKAKDGWRFKAMWNDAEAKIYGLKGGVAVFERLKKK